MLKLAGIALAMASSAICIAQEAGPSAAAPVAQSAIAEPSAASACCRLVDGTPVILEIQDPLNSSLLKRGDKFRLRLAGPLMIDDRILVAAGAEGVGEVIHAEKSRGGGKPGELLIAARYLDYQGQQIGLRGLRVGGSGKDKSAAALATSMVVGAFALFIHGQEIEIPSGTLAQAKIAQDIDLHPVDLAKAVAVNSAIPGVSPSQAGDPASRSSENATPQPTETTQPPKE
ncbi:hypothetical protein DT603_03680 [Pseudoxanthomonas gei]|uniref:Uncharacterized protein n=1 Tax=Pseudoxanthomonas gei TaxID=1383030 RepID=A0ABX0A8U3_9GAMM|nr:hypothetical protein [Pseudoxanthomonas gei]NDK37939.1 hypothetical protein [Pseudoxanthomonas gei]